MKNIIILKTRLFIIIAASLILFTPCFSKTSSSNQDLKNASKDKIVENELAEPDGASLQLLPDGGWRIFATGTGVYDINDGDEIRQAAQDAQLRAKANIAKFLKEKVTTAEFLSNATKKIKQLSTSGNDQKINISKEDVQQRIEIITNSADAILRGIVVIESTKTPRSTNGGEVRVKIGCSSKSIKAASDATKDITNSFNQEDSDNSEKKPNGNNSNTLQNTGEVKKSKTDL
jgi:hypothetical protein